MKRVLLLSFLPFFLLIPSVFAGEGWMYSSGEIEMDLEISSSITITQQGGGATVDSVSANLSFIPREDERQEVVSVSYDPKAELKDGAALFTWKDPAGYSFDYGLSARIWNTNSIPEIPRKVAFPLKDAGHSLYLEPQDVIDSDNPEINKAASAIVDGETDLYMAVGKLAAYVMDTVEYTGDDPAVASGTKPASWVLQNKRGVCDEMTGLFMALARSVGIPAKYVSGLAYTNLNGMDDWGPHAWAEIYFPGTGWVPYDVTYGEIGFIDATHIKLQESLDADESSTSYAWRGRSIDLKAEELTMEVDLVKTEGTFEPPITLSTRFLKEKTGFGSYNAVEVTATNKRQYYAATEITLSRTLEVEMEDQSEYVMLAPLGKKTIYFLTRLSDRLDPGYLYTIPVSAFTTRNVSAGAMFQAQEQSPVYSRQDIERLLSGLREEEEKEYSKELAISCAAAKDTHYANESFSYSCELENQGNVVLSLLSVCLEGECIGTTLGIGKKETVTFEKRFDSPGDKELLVTAKNALVSRQHAGFITIEDMPSLTITEIEHPESIGYNEEREISFLLKKDSGSTPTDTKVTVRTEGFTKEWDLGEMETDQKFIIAVKGKNFREGENEVTVIATYKDGNKRTYETTENFSVTLSQINIFQKMALMINRFEDWVSGLFG